MNQIIKVYLSISLIIFANTFFGQLSDRMISSENNAQDTAKAKYYLSKALTLDKQIEVSLSPEEKFEKLQRVHNYLYDACRLDTNQNISSILMSVAQQYFYTGVELFNKGLYSNSLIAFEKNIEILSRPDISELDTIIFFNTALAAEKSNEFEKAEFYYRKLIEYNYDSWSIYVALANLYKIQDRDVLFFSTINKGISIYPNDKKHFIDELLAYYLEKEWYNFALVSVDYLIKTDSLNDYLLYLKGSIYNQQNNIIKAEEQYRKCLELAPNNVDASFNLSTILYDKVFLLTKSNKYLLNENKKVNQYCTQIINHLDIVLQQTPNDIQVLKMLLFCYHHLDNKQKKEEISKRIKQLYKG